MTKKKFYLTTAIPYVNAKPHIGHALEYVVADSIHRFKELEGKEVLITSGADENALKNVQAAEKEGVNPKKFLDKYSKIFQDFYRLLEVELDEFRRGTDKRHHWPGVQKLWKLADSKGDIYKKTYKGLYCVGCESFKTNKDLVDGKCPDHDKAPEKVEEENHFFRLSKYQDKLLRLIETDKYKIYPEKRKNEVLSFIKEGLEDFSISRSNERARGFGVPVPEDDTQKMYVWFDALNIYQTAVGYGYNDRLWKKWWPADLHVIGKDIIRFHAVYWPAILMSAGLPLPKSLLVHGFITSGGRKMGKSLGNVIEPYKIIDRYGVEATRYYLLAKIPTLDDGDFTIDSFEQVYQADLANGLGNLVARISKLAEINKLNPRKLKAKRENRIIDEIKPLIDDFKINSALEYIWGVISGIDKYINRHEVWKLNNKEAKSKLKDIIVGSESLISLLEIAEALKPFLPKTAEKIEKQFEGTKIKSEKPLFPRLR